MRFVLFLFVLIVGLGALSLLTMDDATAILDSPPPANGVQLAAAAVESSQPAAVSTFTQVDRDDDPAAALPCTTAPNDCSLRAALEIANTDDRPTLITFADHYLITLQRPLPALTAAETVVRAEPGQQVFINGNSSPGAVFSILGRGITLEGLHIYAAGAGYPNVSVSGTAYDVRIVNNVIGDDDAPGGNCGQSAAAYGGIAVTARAEEPDVVHAWIYGNIIECHTGAPGTGVLVRTDRVVIGHDGSGCGSGTKGNTIRANHGHGIDVGNYSGSVICGNQLHDNRAGSLIMSNFNNNLMDNAVN